MAVTNTGWNSFWRLRLAAVVPDNQFDPSFVGRQPPSRLRKGTDTGRILQRRAVEDNYGSCDQWLPMIDTRRLKSVKQVALLGLPQGPIEYISSARLAAASPGQWLTKAKTYR